MSVFVFQKTLILPNAGVVVTVFHAQGSWHVNQDRWFAQLSGNTVRAAAIDGVTTWRPFPCPGGDPGSWAANTVQSYLGTATSLESSLRKANQVLYDPTIRPSRRRAMAAVAAVDCTVQDSLIQWEGIVSADCEIWVGAQADKPMIRALGGDFLQPKVRAEWEALKQAQEVPWSFDERLTHEAVLLEEPGSQVSHAIGRYEDPVLLQGKGSTRFLVLASDGAHLEESVQHGVTVSVLPSWLSSLEQRTDRDDLTCLVITLTG